MNHHHHLYDVLIVGGGVAGLSAAQTLVKAGKSVVILEATASLGGRVKPMASNGTTVELGAEYVHGSPETLPYLQPCETAEVEKFNFFDADAQGNLHLAASSFKTWNNFAACVPQNIEKETTLLDYLNRTALPKQEREALKFFAHTYFAADPDKLLMSLVLAEDTEEQEKLGRPKSGYAPIVARLIEQTKGCAICPLTPVKSVKAFSDHVQVQCVNGSLVRAKYVIVTAALGVLKNKGIDIHPISTELKGFFHSAQMGGVVKLNLIFKGRAWPVNPIFIRNPYGKFETWMSNDERPVIIGWCGGPESFLLAKKTARELCDLAMKELSELLQLSAKDLAMKVIDIDFHNWNEDQYFRGAYSYPAALNAKNLETILEQQICSRIGFAGEAYDTQGATGTVQAAYFSGRTAAQQVIALLM